MLRIYYYYIILIIHARNKVIESQLRVTAGRKIIEKEQILKIIECDEKKTIERDEIIIESDDTSGKENE